MLDKTLKHREYTKRDRVVSFDILRGLFLVIIAINHLGIVFGPSLFLVITGASRLPASAAEGFFLISGIMVGYVYGPRVARWGFGSVVRHLWKRAGLLWFLSVFFTLLFTACVLFFPESEKYSTLYARDEISFLYNTLLLRFSFGWTDFLGRYAWFMFFAPFALWFITRKMTWLVVLVSGATWFLLRHNSQLLPFSSWQIIFFIGIVVGYYFPSIERFYTSLHSKIKKCIYYTITLVAVSTIVVSLVSYVIIPLISSYEPSIITSSYGTISSYIVQLLSGLISKEYLDPLRLLIGAIWFTALYMFIRKNEHSIDTLTGGVLSLLGRNALFVYCLHAIILLIIDTILRPLGNNADIIVNTLLAALFVSILYITTKLKVK